MTLEKFDIPINSIAYNSKKSILAIGLKGNKIK